MSTVKEEDELTSWIDAQPKSRSPIRWKAGYTGLAFVTPAVAVVSIFFAYPVVATFLWSFQDWNSPGDRHRWVGLFNYTHLTTLEPYFGKALFNTILWTGVTVPAQLLVGLIMALALDRKFRGRTFFRTVFFLPAIFSSVVIAFVWNWIYDPEQGTITQVMQLFGSSGQAWLSQPGTALPSIIVVSIWRYSGFIMLFYLAAMQGIPTDMYEAAAIDGAGWWHKTRYNTLPLLRPMTALLVLFGLIGALREFELIWVMTSGGPAHLTDLLSVQVYQQAFINSEPGSASAIGTVLLALVAASSAVMLFVIGRAQNSVR